MIPKIIHYCWFGRGEKPQQVNDCIASWHTHMPDWEFIKWDESNFDIHCCDYVEEAYGAGKYAFVSDLVRLKVLKEYGGVYLDTDVEVFKPFDELIRYHGFGGFEGSKRMPLLTAVLASEPNGKWVSEMLSAYEGRHFINADGSLDLTTNVQFITAIMATNGFIQNGAEQDYKDFHIFPVDYFCPRLTTGEYIKTDHTYCDHLGACSWNTKEGKPLLLKIVGPQLGIKLIKLKRKILG